ncbi:hypothetical protein CYMTET_29988, partial [Cymbomonas tetramitiformis]
RNPCFAKHGAIGLGASGMLAEVAKEYGFGDDGDNPWRVLSEGPLKYRANSHWELLKMKKDVTENDEWSKLAAEAFETEQIDNEGMATDSEAPNESEFSAEGFETEGKGAEVMSMTAPRRAPRRGAPGRQITNREYREAMEHENKKFTKLNYRKKSTVSRDRERQGACRLWVVVMGATQ